MKRDNLASEAPLWRTMETAELEREYSPSSAVGGDYQPFIAQYAARSEVARAACLDIKTLSYGDRPANTIDISVPSSVSPCPLVAFIHGGYWQEGSRIDSFFGADRFAEHGIAYAAIGYTLAPAANLSQIVTECRVAIRTLRANAQSLGADPQRIYLAGSSAGAHLSAMCCSSTVGADDVPAEWLAGVVLLSGIFELEPLLRTSVNKALSMTIAQARVNSPLLLDVQAFPRTIITWGEHETLEFKRQSRAFAQKLTDSSRSVRMFESPTRNHFDVVHDIADDATPLGRHVLQLLSSG